MNDDIFNVTMKIFFVVMGLLLALIVWITVTAWHIKQEQCQARGGDWRMPGLCSDGVNRIIEVRP